ncbi:DUF1826 domain-containing protein [Amphritea opalescens]|uniref:DUF1826 domain-containing protein n=1 Tax=Amphritea opalescens TaxID=2490544 RepID=A0A430KTW3_9GAMM|nr:DUF1826 domain-containing protein [Amphritea opalescens]RTE66754.1 DUF1826 domain-containing protein [Amphritea opalescens]
MERVEDNGYLTDYPNGTNAVIGDSPETMTAIYEEQINLVVVQRSLPDEIAHYCQELVDTKPNFNLRLAINPEQAAESLTSLPNLTGHAAFVDDLVLLVDMYSCLFDLDEVGLRLQVLDRAMCPRFHIDRLGCRLVTTYQGPGTEWLRNGDVDRRKLGAGNMGLSDAESGLYSDVTDIQQVNKGDIVLLKGEGWYGNEGLGAVHRSPFITPAEKRVVVTMDFA